MTSPMKILIGLWENWVNKYPIILIEEGWAENDWERME